MSIEPKNSKIYYGLIRQLLESKIQTYIKNVGLFLHKGKVNRYLP
jgi:hypothetical protein